MAADSKFAKSLKSSFQWIVAVIILVFVLSIIVPPFNGGGLSDHPMKSALPICRAIDLMMFQYAADNNGAYPSGKSSTEVFQKLIDDNYCADPTVFWDGSMKIPGKIKPTSKKLKPENVCWDITVSLSTNSPDEVPVVFLTGYRIEYTPGGKAVPLFKPSDGRESGIAVTYHSNSTTFKKDALPDGAITNFISPDFDPAGKKFQQLTPDGPLSP